MGGKSANRICMMTACLGLAVLAGPAASVSAFAQVGLPPLDGPLRQPLDPVDRVGDRVGERAGSRIDRRVEELEEQVEEAPLDEPVSEAAETIDETAAEALQTAGETADGASSAATSVVDNAAKGVSGAVAQTLRPFALAADPAGWPVEQDIVVTLVDDGELESLNRPGLEIVARRQLSALGLVMVTLRKPAGTNLDRLIAELRAAQPDAVVDFNHVYRAHAASEPTETESADAVPPAGEAATGGALRVGMIDSAVMADHLSLRGSEVVARDFVTNEGMRPLTHGTAVASLIARSANDETEIFSASVFFQSPNYAPGATAESLVAALDWLASERVHAINMSLAGPGNALLEKAVSTLLEEGPPIVAAVGNNGPSGEPLYPAAYADVIGITAVDREGKVFLYANRGEHVDYAALGVNVKVADSEGTWTLQSGTSMASPYIAVVVARMQQANRMPLDALTAALTASAEDLGRNGFDSTFGHGLITGAPVLLSRQ